MLLKTKAETFVEIYFELNCYAPMDKESLGHVYARKHYWAKDDAFRATLPFTVEELVPCQNSQGKNLWKLTCLIGQLYSLFPFPSPYLLVPVL